MSHNDSFGLYWKGFSIQKIEDGEIYPRTNNQIALSLTTDISQRLVILVYLSLIFYMEEDLLSTMNIFL